MVQTRRHFSKLVLMGLAGGLGLRHAVWSPLQAVWAASRKVLGKGTPRESLIHEDPATLDTSGLPITPLEEFQTMGPTAKAVDRAAWRLEVSGLVKRPLRLTYGELTALPPVEREVLLICPGVFVNHGRWKGFSLKGLLQQAEVDSRATRIALEEKGGKRAQFSLADVVSGKVFLAYQVNGKELPRRHGFPLRVVAQDSLGSEWVKYVDHVVVEGA